MKAHRVPAADLRTNQQFIWHGVAYRTICHVKYGIVADRLDNQPKSIFESRQTNFIGATALVKV